MRYVWQREYGVARVYDTKRGQRDTSLALCSCQDDADAQEICDALNAQEKPPTRFVGGRRAAHTSD